MLFIAASTVSKCAQIAPIKHAILARKLLGKFKLSLKNDKNWRGRRAFCIDSLAPYELEWFQKMGIPHNCLSRLRLEAWDVLQKFDLLTSLLEFNLRKTYGKILLVERSKVNRFLSHGFNRRISRSSCQQSVSTETVFLIFLVDFLKVHVVHPLESNSVDCERVGHNVFENLQLGSLPGNGANSASNLNNRFLGFSAVVLVR